MIETLDEIIKKRRSIFPGMYTGEKIDDIQVKQIIENANWAPNHRKTEPWRFKVFTGDALARLGDFLAEKYKETTPPEKFKEMKYKKTRKKLDKSSHVIALCVKRDPQEVLPEWEELAALSCAVQNMYLSCTARGIGCYWSSPKTIIGKPSILDLPDDERCYGLLFMGVPMEELGAKSTRGDVTLKTEWIIT